MATVAERLTGDEPAEVIERHRARYRKAIGLTGQTGGVWLDVGCGDGYGTEMCARVADRAIGIDRHVDGEFRDGYSLMWGDATLLPTGHYQYDAILAVELLEHLAREDQPDFVRRCSRSLTETGALVICCPIGDGPNPDNPWHLHEPTADELEGMLRDHFTSVSVGVEDYESTSGPAVQAYAVARGPRA